ncbi:MAG: DUF3568 family protein [Opitutales bacterium]
MQHSDHTIRARRLSTLALALLLALLPGLAGCVLAAAGAGAGTVAYMGRTLEVTLPNDYNKVVRAVQKTIPELEFTKISEQKDALKAVFVSRTALDKKVEITLTNTGNKATQVVILVGLVGDKELSIAILDKIKALL